MKKQKNKQEKINKIVKLAFITDSGYAMPTVVAIQSAICNKKMIASMKLTSLVINYRRMLKKSFIS